MPYGTHFPSLGRRVHCVGAFACFFASLILETWKNVSFLSATVVSPASTMSEFLIKDEDLASLRGKVVVITGIPSHHFAGYTSFLFA